MPACACAATRAWWRASRWCQRRRWAPTDSSPCTTTGPTVRLRVCMHRLHAWGGQREGLQWCWEACVCAATGPTAHACMCAVVCTRGVATARDPCGACVRCVACCAAMASGTRSAEARRLQRGRHGTVARGTAAARCMLSARARQGLRSAPRRAATAAGFMTHARAGLRSAPRCPAAAPGGRRVDEPSSHMARHEQSCCWLPATCVRRAVLPLPVPRGAGARELQPLRRRRRAGARARRHGRAAGALRTLRVLWWCPRALGLHARAVCAVGFCAHRAPCRSMRLHVDGSPAARCPASVLHQRNEPGACSRWRCSSPRALTAWHGVPQTHTRTSRRWRWSR